MKKINLKRLLKDEALRTTLTAMAEVAPGLSVFDEDDNLLWGKGDRYESLPLVLGDDTIGLVTAQKNASCVSSLLSYLARQEQEKKTLANETLDRYKEVTLLYSLTEKLSSSLDVYELSKRVLEEALKNLPGDSASVFVADDGEKEFVSIAAAGIRAPHPNVALGPGRGIAGAVYANGRPEIVNDVLGDPRYLPGTNRTSSMMCAPLKVKEKTFGVVNLSSSAPHAYTASDLKLLNAITSQAAYAIENARLHEQTLKEERIKTNLQRYISSNLVEAIIGSQGNISLDPQLMDITILFSDIRNFTTKCEVLPPEKIVGYLNDYFSDMVDVIFSYQGTINKFVGDMIVALFGAPSSMEQREKQGVLAAIAMQRKMAEMPNPWIRENFATGIGINRGDVVVGNIGSRQHMDYTAIGDEVNVASRLQALAKGGQILVTESVYELTKSDFEYRKMGRESLKGKRKEVDIYEVMYNHM